MHVHAPARHGSHANDNDIEVHKPPSTTVGAARTILIANADNDVVLLKDAAPAYPFGDTALSGSTRLFDTMQNFCVDHQAANCLGEMLPDDFRTSTGWHALVPAIGVPFLRNRNIAVAIAGARRLAFTALRARSSATTGMFCSLGFAITGACAHPATPTSLFDFSTRLLVRGAAPLVGIPANDLC